MRVPHEDGAIASGFGPPRSQCRRLAARERVAPRFLNDVIPRTRARHLLAREPRKGPGRTHRIRYARPQRQPQPCTFGLHLVQQGRFASKEMRAPRDVGHKRLGRLLGNPRAELARPATECSQNVMVDLRVHEPRLKRGTHGIGIAQWLTSSQPRRLSLGRKRNQHLFLPPPAPRPQKACQACQGPAAPNVRQRGGETRAT